MGTSEVALTVFFPINLHVLEFDQADILWKYDCDANSGNGIPLRLLETIFHEVIRPRSGDVHWEWSLSPNKRGLERVAHDRAFKWMPSGEKPNVIKILHSAVC